MDVPTAKRIQAELGQLVRVQPLKKLPEMIAGVDAAFIEEEELIWAAAVVMELPQLRVIETSVVSGRINFPYIPGLLAFREGPVILDALEKLSLQPDLILFDGHGIAHPQRAGIATHFGILLNKPTIGCAKTPLIGTYDKPDEEKGSHSSLTFNGEQIGLVVRSRTGIKPVYVSPGHLVDFNDSLQIVLQTCNRYRLPEPIRLAHQAANKARRLHGVG